MRDENGTRQDELKFEYPDPSKKVSARNKKIFQVHLANGEDLEYSVQFEFESRNLKACRETGDNIVLKLLSQGTLERISAVVKPSHSLLCDILDYFDTAEDQLNFLSAYFGCFAEANDICGLADFIRGDIKDTINEANFSEGEWNDFKKRALKRHIFEDEIICDENPTEFISQLFSCYKTASLLPVAKSRILAILKEVKPEWVPHEKLLPDNCRTLAEALLFIPVSQLKLDIKKAFHRNVFAQRQLWHELREFVLDIRNEPMEQ